jgi:hypothetical protein
MTAPGFLFGGSESMLEGKGARHTAYGRGKGTIHSLMQNPIANTFPLHDELPPSANVSWRPECPAPFANSVTIRECLLPSSMGRLPPPTDSPPVAKGLTHRKTALYVIPGGPLGTVRSRAAVGYVRSGMRRSHIFGRRPAQGAIHGSAKLTTDLPQLPGNSRPTSPHEDLPRESPFHPMEINTW